MENSAAKATLNFWLLTISFIMILAGAGLGTWYTARANYLAAAKIAANKEAARPANIEATTITDVNCPECFDIAPILANLEKANIKLVSERILDRTSAEAQTLVAKYAIEKLPALILKGEVQKDAALKTALASAGDISGDTFVLKQIGGPYVIPATGEIKGKTELTLISDLSCQKCYDARQHQAILAQFGVNPRIKFLDVASPEAKSLINKYKIALVPAFVLTGEVAEYPTFVKIWPQVGVVENGAYVFAQGVKLMGVYKDLKTGKIIDPAEADKPTGAAPQNSGAQNNSVPR